MPLITVQTSATSIPKSNEFLKALSAEISKLTRKPEQYVMAILNIGVPMSFAGSSEPSCYIEIKSIGALNPSQMSAAICELVNIKTGINSNRIYISFEDVPASLWGWNGRTFG